MEWEGSFILHVSLIEDTPETHSCANSNDTVHLNYKTEYRYQIGTWILSTTHHYLRLIQPLVEHMDIVCKCSHASSHRVQQQMETEYQTIDV